MRWRTTMLLMVVPFTMGAVAVNGDTRFVHAKLRTEGVVLQVIQFAEQWKEQNPAFGDNNWRTVLCAEITETGAQSTRRIWQRCELGKKGFAAVRSFVLSSSLDHHLAMAYCSENTIFAACLDLQNKVSPLPQEMSIDRASSKRNWNDSPVLVIPDTGVQTPFGKALKPLGVAELGRDLSSQQQVFLNAITRVNTGWRIEAAVHDTKNLPEPILPDGTKASGPPSSAPIIRFAVLLDDKCESAKIEAARATLAPRR